MSPVSLSEQDIANLRADTPGASKKIHFNNAGTGLALAPVLEAVKTHLDLEAETGGYEAHALEEQAYNAFYSNIAALIGARPSEIAFVENATRAWDMAFYSIDFRPGDRVLTGRAEYVSNYLAFLHLKAKTGLEIDLIDDDQEGQIDLRALEDSITPRTRLIALTHVPTFGGLINPAEEVGDIARRHNLLFLLDACQSIGHLALDVTQLGCHILSGTGRKYLRGPRGTGFLYVSENVLDQLHPPFVDLASADWVDANAYELKPDARRFENWERYVAGQIGLGVAAGYAIGIGMDRISTRICDLAASLRTELASSGRVVIHDRGRNKCGIVTFQVKGETPLRTKKRLAAEDINVSVSTASSARIDLPVRGLSSLVRASVHAFNTEEEIQTFTRATTENC